MVRLTHVAESPNILINPPKDRHHSDLWQNQLPRAVYENMTVDADRIHTLFTSPRRSIIRCNAFLLSPMRPSRNTISGTRSRSVQILYAWRGILSNQK
jgi:hypothetical protein